MSLGFPVASCCPYGNSIRGTRCNGTSPSIALASVRTSLGQVSTIIWNSVLCSAIGRGEAIAQRRQRERQTDYFVAARFNRHRHVGASGGKLAACVRHLAKGRSDLAFEQAVCQGQRGRGQIDDYKSAAIAEALSLGRIDAVVRDML